MPQWNTLFTSLLREREPRMWGNWGLSGDIKLGAVGQLTSDGDFRPVGTLPGVVSSSIAGSETWQMSTTNVKRSQGSVTIDATGKAIPVGATGATAGGTLGTTITWAFNASNELSSEFSVSRREGITNEADLVTANKALLNSLATSVGMAAAGAIDQGFGFITGIVWAKSGANVAAFTAGSTFSITGEVAPMASFGSATASVSAKAAYSSSSQEGNLDTHVWPATPNCVPDAEVPVAYKFTSFEGNVVLVDWIGFVQNVVFEFQNVGSWIASVHITYQDSTGTVDETYSGISGGLSRQILLPIDAGNVHFVVSYVATPTTHPVTIPAPLQQSASGQFNYKIGGLWPSGPTLTPQ